MNIYLKIIIVNAIFQLTVVNEYVKIKKMKNWRKKMKYLAVRNCDQKGVYQYKNKDEKLELLKKFNEFSIRNFNDKKAALNYADVKEVENREQKVVQEKKERKTKKKVKNTKETNIFDKLIEKSKKFDTNFAKITMINGDTFIVTSKEFVLLHEKLNIEAIRTSAKYTENKKVQILLDAIDVRLELNSDINIENKILEYFRHYSRHIEEYILLTKIEFFEDVFRKILSYNFHDKKVTYSIVPTINYEQIGEFVFLENVIHDITETKHQKHYLTSNLITKESIINVNQIVKIEPYNQEEKWNNFILTDSDFVKIVKKIERKMNTDE